VGKQGEAARDESLGGLLGQIADDAKELLKEQLELFRAEVAQEARRAGGAAASVAAGGALTAAGGLLGGFMLAHLLHRATGLPLWACYGLVAGGVGAAGVKLLLAGRDGFAGLRPLPQTTEALGENLQWLTATLNPAGR
jgi:hypothetical protein